MKFFRSTEHDTTTRKIVNIATIINTDENHGKKENDQNGMSVVEIVLIITVVGLSVGGITAIALRYFRLRQRRNGRKKGKI